MHNDYPVWLYILIEELIYWFQNILNNFFSFFMWIYSLQRTLPTFMHWNKREYKINTRCIICKCLVGFTNLVKLMRNIGGSTESSVNEISEGKGG